MKIALFRRGVGWLKCFHWFIYGIDLDNKAPHKVSARFSLLKAFKSYPIAKKRGTSDTHPLRIIVRDRIVNSVVDKNPRGENEVPPLTE